MAFIESTLLDRVSYGFEGGPGFNTTRVPLFSGIVARNAERSTPLHEYSAPYNSIALEHRTTLIAVFNACVPGPHSFRFKDRADYTLSGEAIGTGTGGADQTLQITKTYTFGGQSTVRNIVKPVTGTVVLLQDGGALASTVDTTTGIVTFTSAAGGEAITASCSFDVPVMFTDDRLLTNFANWDAHTAEINLMEDLSA